MRAQREVVVLVPREARQVEDDDELDAALVRAAELQQLLQLGAIGGLRALAFLAESREDVEALARQYSSQAFSWVGRLRFSVCSLVLTRT
jgi:phosphoserine aminotransferase